MFDADEALRIGLAQFVGSGDELARHLDQVVNEICQGAPEAIIAMKEIIDSAATGLKSDGNADLNAAEARNLELERAHSVALVESDETKRRVGKFLGGRR